MMSEREGLREGALVWVADAQEGFVAGVVGKSGPQGSATVRVESGPQRGEEIEAGNGALLRREVREPVQDMVQLQELNEGALLHNLRARFERDEIYTNVGAILVAINPFKQLPLYTPAVMDRYKDSGTRETAPHVFKVAREAYSALSMSGKPQSCVISGESGAGKTETTKLFLQYLTEVSAAAPADAQFEEGASEPTSRGGLQEQILQANPLLEAFGNAKTVRNNNSSRFGKWINILFDGKRASMKGARITSYLLEKSRLVHQSADERNYHVFYQLCAAARRDRVLRDRLQLGEPNEYHYLNQGNCVSVEGMNDETGWEQMQRALAVMQVEPEQRDQIAGLLAALLHLGNVTFTEEEKAGEGQARIAAPEALARAAQLLGVAPAALEGVLTSRRVGVRSLVYKSYTKPEAEDTRDALAKSVYGLLFQWLISRVNACLGASAEESATTEQAIGVLDIFGFESFEVNSFEQLCINYCNEKLQLHFNQHIFAMEQAEYREQGVDIGAIQFIDNAPCVNALEAKSTGVFAMIDEEINVPRGSDAGFLAKVLKRSDTDAVVRKPSIKHRASQTGFTVSHYAGDVTYTVTDFLAKNKDAVHDGLQICLAASELPLLRELLAAAEAAAVEPAAPQDEATSPGSRTSRSSSRLKRSTLGLKFKEQLKQLMASLAATEPHFVRCIKPNAAKSGGLFEPPMVLDQLRCAGLLEVCRIRRVGYPVRYEFDEFERRFAPVARPGDGAGAGGAAALCEALRAQGVLDDGVSDAFKLGTSKVFLRDAQHQRLEQLRETALHDHAARLQAFARMHACRSAHAEYKAVLAFLAVAEDTVKLAHGLELSADLPYGGEHVPQVKAARERLAVLKEQARVIGLLEEAIGAGEPAALNAALKAGVAAGLENHPVLSQAREALQRVEETKQMRLDLSDAIASRDEATLSRLLARATSELGLSPEQDGKVRQATALVERLRLERDMVADLDHALATSCDPGPLRAIMARMTESGVAVSAGAERVYRLLCDIDGARRHRDLARLRDALESPELGPDNKSAETIALLEELELEEELRAALADEDLARIEDARARLAATAAGETGGLADEAASAVQRLTLREDMAAACAAQDASAAKRCAAMASELGLTQRELPCLDQALELAGGADRRLAQAIAACRETREMAALAALVQQASAEGAQSLLASAKAAFDELERELATLGGLGACRTAAQVEASCAAARLKGGAAQALEAAKQVERLILAAKTRDCAALETAAQRARQAGLEGMAARAEEDLAAAREREHLEAGLREAMQANDSSRMSEILDELGELERQSGSSSAAMAETSELVETCRTLVSREHEVGDLQTELERHVKEEDLEGIDAALESMIRAGVSLAEEESIRVHELRGRLERQRQSCADVVSAARLAQSQAGSSAGLQAGDLDDLQTSLKAHAGEKPELAEVRRAREVLSRLETQILVQGELEMALQENKLASLQRALEIVNEHELEHLALADEVRKALRAKDALRRAAQRAAYEAGVPFEGEEAAGTADETERKRAESAATGDEEAMRKALLERRERARDARYDFARFHKIRSDESFARGVFLLNKSRAKKDKLVFQPYAINKSVTDLGADKEVNRAAVRLHKAILGYCGDKSMAFPAALGHDLLTQGVERPELVDEIFVLLCKQLTANPRPESVGRALQLLCLAVSTFPPSAEFEMHLFNFLLRNSEVVGLVGTYATFALRRLEGMVATGACGFVPSVEEILAYNDRPPFLARIELPDGTLLTEELPVTPDLDVAEVNNICAHFLGLSDRRKETFGLALDGKLPLRRGDYLGDEFARATRENARARFVFRRILVLRADGEDEPSLDDEAYNRMVFLQAQAEFVENHYDGELDEEETMALVAESLAAERGDELPADLTANCGLAGFVPPSLACQDLNAFAAKVRSKIDEEGLTARDPSELRESFLRRLRAKRRYGQLVFPTEDRGDLEVDCGGVHFEGRSFGFPELYRWGGSSHSFTLVLWTPGSDAPKTEVSFETPSGMYIGGLLLEYVKYIMARVKSSGQDQGGHESADCDQDEEKE